MGSKNRNPAQKDSLVFDPKERIDFVKGFGKRKQERKERAKQKAIEKDKEIRKLLRQKRREALKKARVGGNEDKSSNT